MSNIAVNKNKTSKVAVNENMQDYSKEPFFVKKAEKATAFLKKHGLPKIQKKVIAS